MPVRAAALLLLLTAVVVSGHDWGMGPCPSVRAMTGLDVDRFLGEWYVIEQFDTSSSCLMLNFTKESETRLRIEKIRQLPVLSEVGLGHNTYGGTLDMPQANSGKFRVKWPLNVAGKADFYLLETDYDTYAGVYDCQPLPLMHRQSASILSRTPSLPPTIANRVKNTLRSFRIDVDPFRKVEQGGCRPRTPSDVHLHFDSDTVPGLIDDAREGIGGIADSINNFATSITGDGSPATSSPTTAAPSSSPTTAAPGPTGRREPFVPVEERSAGGDILSEGDTEEGGSPAASPRTTPTPTTSTTTTTTTTPAPTTPTTTTTTTTPAPTTTTRPTTTTTTTTTTEAPNRSEDFPDNSINGIDSPDSNLDENFYNVDGIEPVDDIIRTVVDATI